VDTVIDSIVSVKLMAIFVAYVLSTQPDKQCPVCHL